jgi:hypothetical protein
VNGRPTGLAGILIVMALLAAGHASAASVTLNTAVLSGTQLAISHCDTALSVSWTTEFDTGLGAFTVDIVSLENVAGACDGSVFQVTLADASNAALGSGSYADPVGAAGQIDPGGGGTQTVAFDFTGQAVLDSQVAVAAWSIAP